MKSFQKRILLWLCSIFASVIALICWAILLHRWDIISEKTEGIVIISVLSAGIIWGNFLRSDFYLQKNRFSTMLGAAMITGVIVEMVILAFSLSGSELMFACVGVIAAFFIMKRALSRHNLEKQIMLLAGLICAVFMGLVYIIRVPHAMLWCVTLGVALILFEYEFYFFKEDRKSHPTVFGGMLGALLCGIGWAMWSMHSQSYSSQLSKGVLVVGWIFFLLVIGFAVTVAACASRFTLLNWADS